MATASTSQIPLVNLSAQSGASNATTGTQAGSVQPSRISGQVQSSPPRPGPLTSISSQSQTRPATQQPRRHVLERYSWKAVFTWVGLGCTAAAMIWAIATGGPLLSLAKWTAHNDYLQTCIAILEIDAAGRGQCNDTIQSGPVPPPYIKRDHLRTDTHTFVPGTQLLADAFFFWILCLIFLRNMFAPHRILLFIRDKVNKLTTWLQQPPFKVFATILIAGLVETNTAILSILEGIVRVLYNFLAVSSVFRHRNRRFASIVSSEATYIEYAPTTRTNRGMEFRHYAVDINAGQLSDESTSGFVPQSNLGSRRGIHAAGISDMASSSGSSSKNVVTSRRGYDAAGPSRDGGNGLGSQTLFALVRGYDAAGAANAGRATGHVSFSDAKFFDTSLDQFNEQTQQPVNERLDLEKALQFMGFPFSNLAHVSTSSAHSFTKYSKSRIGSPSR